MTGTHGGGKASQRHVVISDCTLREGEQQPGVVLDRTAKMRIAERLAEIGITRAELGTPAVSPDERTAIADIVRAGLIPESLVVCRAMKRDVELAAECGAWGAVVSSPVSPWQLQHKLHRELPEVVEGALEVHAYARSLGLRTFASAYDTLRTPWRSLEKLYGAIAAAGHADGVRLVDTVGVGTPERVRRLVSRIRRAFGLPLEVHFHDDLGLAMANAIAAVGAGAESVSSSVAGVGERAGHIATEEIIAALEIGYGIDTGCALDRLGPASRDIVATIAAPLSLNKSIVGENAFRHVAGLSVSGFLRNPLVAQPFEAEVVGLVSKIVIGKTSGRDGLEHRLTELGLDPGELDVPLLLATVKRRSEHLRRLISDEELRRIAEDLASAGHEKEEAT
jgi:isopropylmalate/homocitrate/citramalate synthase